MKHMKKLMALFAALALVLTMAIPAMAAEPTYTISTNKAGHTYEVYQIFTGELSGTILSNVKWGQNSNATKRGSAAIGDSVDSTIVEGLQALNTANEETIRNTVTQYVDFATTPVAVVTSTSSQNVSAGYYIIKDKDNSLNDTQEAYTNYIVKVVGDLVIQPKSDVPTVDKDVKDINDSTENALSEWKKTADHDVGDKVPFRLVGTLPNNYDSYTKYEYIFHDTMSAGLTFDESTVEVYYGESETAGTKISSGYTVTQTPQADGSTQIDIAFADLKAVTSFAHTDKIIVVYKAELNNNAVMGSTGNPNKVYLEFSNNPNGEGKGKTAEHQVIVFTYQVAADKTDEHNNPLAGAAFQLSKFDKIKNNWVVVGYRNVKLSATGEPEKDADGKYVIDNASATSFGWERIDDGKYKLEEIITPAGYNTIKPVEFEITATHDDVTLNLGALNGNMATGSAGSLSFVGNVATGTVSTTVENHSGATLPGTGGIGTTIFYVIGGGLMVAAAVLLVTKKRMENK